MNRIPISNAIQLDLLDDKEVIQGYWDGRDGDPEPGDNRSYSYWHGWRNGRVDGGHDKTDAHQIQLAKSMIDTGYLKKMFNDPRKG